MPFSRQDRKKCQDFDGFVRAFTGDPNMVTLWIAFLNHAHAATRGPYGDQDLHYAMVRSAEAFRKCLTGEAVIDSLKKRVKLIEDQMEKSLPGSARCTELSAQRNEINGKIEAERKDGQARLKRMPQGISLIGSWMAIGLPQHTAGKDIVESLPDFKPDVAPADQTPLPQSGTRQKSDKVPASVRRLSATG